LFWPIAVAGNLVGHLMCISKPHSVMALASKTCVFLWHTSGLSSTSCGEITGGGFVGDDDVDDSDDDDDDDNDDDDDDDDNDDDDNDDDDNDDDDDDDDDEDDSFHRTEWTSKMFVIFHFISTYSIIRCSLFVRDDELKHAWKLFDPLLEAIDNKSIPVHIYPRGSRGPPQGDQLVTFVFMIFLLMCSHSTGFNQRFCEE
jgi:hypothetical protein